MGSFSVIRDFSDFTNDQAMAGYQAYTGAAQPQQQFGYEERGRRVVQQGRTDKRRNFRRNKTNFPFVAVSDSTEHKAFPVSRDGVLCFHGFKSVFTLQHRSNFQVDGVLFKSVDQYYQMNKVKDLTGIESAKFTDGSTKNYSALVKELLKQNDVSRDSLEKWRVSRGVTFIQKALLEKLRQCDEYKSALIKTGDKIIVQSYAGDDFFGAGVPFKYVKDWSDGMANNKVSLKFPISFPLCEEAVKGIPTIGKGRNVLGAIHMILREKLNNSLLDTLKVVLDDSAVNNNAPSKTVPSQEVLNTTEKESVQPQEPVKFTSFADGSGTKAPTTEEPMNIDFSADVDADSTSTQTAGQAGGAPVVKSGPAPAKMKITVTRGTPAVRARRRGGKN